MSKRYRVFLIDDNRIEQKLFTLLVNIKQLPLDVTTFIDAESALSSLEMLSDGEFPDAIITDIKMPLMDGFELADALMEKYENKSKDMLFIINSSTIRTEDIERATEHPLVSSFVEKPFNEEKVRQHILGKLNGS